MTTRLQPPPREKKDARHFEQWLEEAWRVLTGIRSEFTAFGDTEWTPTGSWSANTTYTGVYRRNLDVFEAMVKVATSGAPTSANLTINLPTDHTIDTSKLVSTGLDMDLGSVIINDSSTTYYLGRVVYASTTTVAARNADDAAASVAFGNVHATNPITFGAGDFVVLNFRVPILEWAG